MESQDQAVILRDGDGKPIHVVLPWTAFEALRGTTALAPAALARAGRRLGAEISAEVPPEVAAGEAAGVHPVRAWREHRGLSQAQLALTVGISRAYLTQIETGERTGTLEVTAKLARSLNCLIEDLVPVGAGDLAHEIATLGRMPERLRAAITAIGPERRQARPQVGGFSLVEHVCHLRDIDVDGYAIRLERILAEDDPALTGIDGDALALARDYQSQDLEAAFAAFADARAGTLARLGRLRLAERRRSGRMDGTERITVDELVTAMLTHDSEHVQQLDALREEFGRW